MHTFGYPVPYINSWSHKHSRVKFYLGGHQKLFFRFLKMKLDAPVHSRVTHREYVQPYRTSQAHLFALAGLGLVLGKWEPSTVNLYEAGTAENGWVDDVQRHIAKGMRSTFGGSPAADTFQGAGTEHILAGAQPLAEDGTLHAEG